LEKREQIVDMCRTVSFTQRSIHTLHDNADRFTESAKPATEVFV